MKRLISVAILLLTATASMVQAQLLWKVTTPGSSHTSYIFGTHHASSLRLDSLRTVRDVIASVSDVYGEADMQTMETPQFKQAMMTAMMAPADSTLSKIYTPEELAEIDAMLARYTGGQLTTAALDTMTPNALATILSMIVTTRAVPGYDPAFQLDGDIQTAARKAGKNIHGLETPDFQIQTLFGQPISMQASELLRLARSKSDQLADAAALNAAYLSGDLDRLAALMNNPESGMNAEQRDRLIDSRNSAWAQFLCGILPAASIMIVVGAGHLPGDKGILALLACCGFKIEPVEN